MNLYELYNKPTDLYNYEKAKDTVIYLFWDEYYDNPRELKKREHLIAQSAFHSFVYAKNILDGPFPAGEKAIATSARFSYNYANDVLQDRFEEGEDVIFDSEYNEEYIDLLNYGF